MALTTYLSRTQRRTHLADRIRIERLEEDADIGEADLLGLRGEMKKQTQLLFMILLSLLAGVVALAGNLIVAA